jgi:type IV secretion system protein VirB10
MPPKSPDSLQPAIHGPVRGVTRIGRKAIAAAAVVGVAVLMLIVFGAQNSPSTKKTDESSIPSAPASVAAVVPGHFGDNVPLALPTAIPTPSPTPALETPTPEASATTPSQQGSGAPGAPGSLQAQQSEAQVNALRAAQERHVAQVAAQDARQQVIASAFHAPIMMGGSGSGAAGSGANGVGAGPTALPETSPSPGSSHSPLPVSSGKDPTAFLNGPTGQLANGGADKAVSGDRIPPATPYEVVAGSVIPADLITAINSQNPGLITGQVREDVYDSLSGRFLLIPRGSKLIGVYKNDVSTGQSRILVAWKRLIVPDTAAIDLVNMSGADTEGNAGFEGRVDTHFGQILAQTLLASVITAGLQLSQPQQATSSTTTGSTTVVPPGAIAAGSIGQSVAQTLNSEIQQNANVAPTIYIPKGYPFLVVVDRDLVLTSPYGGAL